LPDDLSVQLNPAQREAVDYMDGPLLVLAGAGSGKTGVITQKIGSLIRQSGIAPHRIAAITFTNKAAKEMHERVGRLIGSGADGLIISTFHSLGVRILRQEGRALGLKAGFSIFDAGDALALCQERAGNIDKARMRQLQSRISLWKNSMLDAEQAMAAAQDDTDRAAAALYVEYERSLRAYQAVDFDDLIRLPVQLFEQHEEIAQKWRSRIWHLLVDEYQDTNKCQYRLMRLLTDGRESLTAVGDDDQSIYAWRGASADNLHALKTDYPRLKVIKLEQNYRSTGQILGAANALIAHNPKLFDKRLWSEIGNGAPIRIQTSRNDEEEANWVAAQLSAHRFSHRTKYSDYAILYRSNHQARLIEQQLRAQKIPYVISVDSPFSTRARSRTSLPICACWPTKTTTRPSSVPSTTPKRGIGSTTLEALGRAAAQRHKGLFETIFIPELGGELTLKQHQSLRQFADFIRRIAWRAEKEPAGEVLDDMLRAIGYEASLFSTLEPREAESRWSNVLDFTGWVAKKGQEEGKTLLELAQSIALITMLEKGEESHDAVQLATLHASKGLEFRHVFLVGVEEGLLPHRDSLESPKLEEERRLMYVGITRAQASLTVSWCEKRRQGREWMPREASRFITEMGAQVKTGAEQRNAVPDQPKRAIAPGNYWLASRTPAGATKP
jgi:ATP-dependent DNA helicase Rep